MSKGNELLKEKLLMDQGLRDALGESINGKSRAPLSMLDVELQAAELPDTVGVDRTLEATVRGSWKAEHAGNTFGGTLLYGKVTATVEVTLDENDDLMTARLLEAEVQEDWVGEPDDILHV